MRRQVMFGAAVGLAAVVFHDALAQRLVGGLLIGLADRGVDAKAARIDVLGIMLGKRLPDHFRDILRVNGVFVYFAAARPNLGV